MKKHLSLILTLILLVGLLSGCGGEEETVAVQSVKSISDQGSLGFVNRYAGTVVSGESAEIKKDPDMLVTEVNVKEGDNVKKGDVLFSYDLEALQLKLDKLNLEYEELQNKITSAETNIPILEKKAARANATDQLGYNLQIQSLQADILESNYNLSLKKREITALETAMDNVEVVAPIDGRVMSVQDSDSKSLSGNSTNYDPNAGSGSGASSDVFMTITDVETFRVKGVINEMNVGTLYEGIPVLIRSRLDESVTWNGVLEKIDWENTVTDSSSNMYYVSSSESTSSTKYPFYVTLENFDGMLMGQHMFIEPDYGQNSMKDGLWIPDYYIASEENGSTFVWAQSSHAKLEKRIVTLGDRDEDSGLVEILSGISKDDSIAYPDESLHAGMTCVPYSETMFSGDEGGDDEEYNDMAEGAVMAGGVG